MPKKPFAASQFTPTQWSTPEEKAKFANHFVRFVESGFRVSMFPKWFYNRLSMTFGHIAHYNQDGFWSEFFTNPHDQCKFLHQTMAWSFYGDPHYTYCDVEKAIQEWLAASGLCEKLAAERDKAIETAEREIYKKLHAKYGGVT